MAQLIAGEAVTFQNDRFTLRDARVKESDEIRPGVIADFGYDGGVVGFEILQASKVVEQAGEMQFAVAG